MSDEQKAAAGILAEGAPSGAGSASAATQSKRTVEQTPARPGVGGKVTWAKDVKPERVRWLLPGRVPLGAVTILAGDPGLGKSTMTALWAAELSRGHHGSQAGTLFVGSEDSPSRVVVPRLMAAGADLDRVGFFAATDEDGERDLTVPGDLPALRREIESSGARLVVIDPLNAHLSSATDSHKDASLRKALAPLARDAHECDVAVVAVMHLNKSPGGQPLYRLGGSVGYGGLARSVLGFTRRPEDSERDPRRLLVHVKCNLAPLAPTLLYQHAPNTVSAGTEVIDTHRLDFIAESAVTATEAFGSAPKDTKEDRAEDAILDALADGPRPSADVKAVVVRALGCAARTVERAASGLEKDGRLTVSAGGFPNRTTWSAPVATAPVATEPLGGLVVTGQASENTEDSAPPSAGHDSHDGRGATCPRCASLLAPNGACFDQGCLKG